MGRYRITMDEFLQLYQDCPDYKVLYRANSQARSESNGNTRETNEELKKLKRQRNSLQLNKLKFWKKGEEDVEICHQKQEDINNNGEDLEPKKRKNPIAKVLRSFGRVMLRHFYFMNVAIENTGGIYVVRYGSPDQSCGMQLEYCYTSSYASTRTSLVY